jgi:prevent-host-death family protein
MESVIGAMEARRNLGRLLEETYYRGDVFIIQRATKPMAVLVPLAQYRQWQMRREQFFALIDQVQERTRQEPVTKLEDAIAEAVAAAKQAERGVANPEARES